MTDTLTDTAVDITAVSVRFMSRRAQTTALVDIDLRVAPREFVTIVGPSGCGKSTLLKMVAGLVKPTAGTVSVMGKQVTGPQKNIGFVFQKAALTERGAHGCVEVAVGVLSVVAARLASDVAIMPSMPPVE